MDIDKKGVHGLVKNKVSFWQMTFFVIVGIGVYGFAYATAGGFTDTAGDAAIYVGILGLILVTLLTLPVLEYTRLVKFEGGYYGMAEMGFGKNVGNFTAFNNYIYYIFVYVGLCRYLENLSFNSNFCRFIPFVLFLRDLKVLL